MLTVDIQTARRFILGKQGLWPGRRWQGVDGTEQAMREMEFLQLDPLRIIARSQDILLHSRVADYTPELWEEVTYRQRKFFDWGGWLAVRPMDELPHWRVAMRRERDEHLRLRKWARDHADAITEMRALLRKRDTVTNRDFRVDERIRTTNYRGRKDSSVALYYLWRIGEIMTYSRDNFERVYALREAVAPRHLLYEADEAEADRLFIRKEIGFAGLLRRRRTQWMERNRHHIERMLHGGDLIEVNVAGWPGTYLALGQDAPLLEALHDGRVPEEWRLLDTSTEEETIFLAPLDPVSARGRAKDVFEFEYIWEVYKPADKRRWGYYTLPVLWGDRLVARFDSKLDRQTNTLVILGFWLEDALPEGGTGTGRGATRNEGAGTGRGATRNAAFAEALARGFRRFGRFLGAEQIDATGIEEPLLRERVASNFD